MGLLSALNAGKTSLLTNQKSIEITGQNITNVNTPGYSRQTPVLTPYPSMAFGDFFIGTGVKVGDISRAHDEFIAAQLKDKSASLGYESVRTAPLQEIEQILGVDDESGIAAQFDRFFDAVQELTNDPNSVVERSLLLQQGGLLTDQINNTFRDLQRVQTDLNNNLIAKVDGINLKLEQVAELNSRIAAIENNGQSANNDRDARDVLLRELAQELGATSIEDERGMAIVSLPGSGLPLVSADAAMTLEYTQVGNNVSFQLDIGGASPIPLPATSFGGEFGGTIDIRDRVLPQAMTELDTLAYEFATSFNTVHAAGTGLNGSTGVNFFTDMTALAAPPAGAALALAVQITDTDDVAAGLSAAPGDNRNALALAALETAAQAGLGNDSYVAYYGKTAAAVGIEVNQNELTSKGLEDSLTQMENLRDSTDGVSLEEEMIQLMKFQQSFEASAKLLSTVDELLGSLLEIKR